jgi:hypothetical protein
VGLQHNADACVVLCSVEAGDLKLHARNVMRAAASVRRSTLAGLPSKMPPSTSVALS